VISDTIADRLLATGNSGVGIALQTGRVKLVRHSPISGYSATDLLFDRNALELITCEQPKAVFSDVDYIFCFLAEEGTTCSFLIAYQVCGLQTKEEFTKRFPKRNFNASYFYYGLTHLTEFDDYWNRLVIDWGKSAISWHQKLVNKQVFCIRPRGFLRPRPRWNRIKIGFRELDAIINNGAGNAEWKDYLSNHDGIYLIRHIPTNKMYVGSAYGNTGGIWGRWEGYVQSLHNGNKGMVEFLQDENNSPTDFVFSLLEIFPKGMTKASIIEAENYHKEILGTRIFGLNRN
jgi:hypothetical protein